MSEVSTCCCLPCSKYFWVAVLYYLQNMTHLSFNPQIVYCSRGFNQQTRERTNTHDLDANIIHKLHWCLNTVLLSINPNLEVCFVFLFHFTQGSRDDGSRTCFGLCLLGAFWEKERPAWHPWLSCWCEPRWPALEAGWAVPQRYRKLSPCLM